MNGIFYIGNNSNWRAIVTNLLRSEGIPCINIFLDSQSAIGKLYLNPDVVIVSDDMSDMEARDVLRLIHNYDRDIDIIVLTGNEELQHTANLLSDGAWDVIRLSGEMQLQLLSSLLQSRKNRQIRNTDAVFAGSLLNNNSSKIASGHKPVSENLPYPPISGRKAV